MILEVKRYHKRIDVHECLCEGEKHTRLFDLMTSRCFPDSTHPESLVGKKFSVGYEHPYITVVYNVQEIRE